MPKTFLKVKIASRSVAWMERSVIREIGPALSCGLHVFRAICIAALLVLAAPVLLAVPVLLSTPAVADDMSDPMRPPASGSATQRTTTQPRWTVTGILISPERKLAMINDRLLGIGEKVDGARIRNIYGNGVELDIDGRSVILRPITGSLRRVE